MDGWMEIKLLGEKKQGKFKKSTLKVKWIVFSEQLGW